MVMNANITLFLKLIKFLFMEQIFLAISLLMLIMKFSSVNLPKIEIDIPIFSIISSI